MHQELYQQIITTLSRQKQTLFTAESCTAGMVSAKLADISGASEVLLGGVVAYHNSIKEKILNVSSDILENYGAVSFECVKSMAIGALEISHADYSLAITGIAGPTGGSPDKPIGTVYTAIHTNNGGWAQRFFLEGSREEIRLQSVELSLRILLATALEEDFFDSRLRDAQEI